MKQSKTVSLITISLIFLSILISFISALSVNVDYITLYPSEQGNIKVRVENNNNYEIEDVSVAITLTFVSQGGEIVSLPFSVIGNSEKILDDLDEGDEDSATFIVKASPNIRPGDYNIPYLIKYKRFGNNSTITQEGSFGIRVSAKTDLDFTLETSDTPVIGKEGQITLEIINKGLGEIRSLSVEFIPGGFTLLSKNKVFIGTIDPEDSDTASFDVLYKERNPIFIAKITYKDFDNQDQIENVSFPIRVYTEEEAKSLGLIKTNNIFFYLAIVVVLIAAYFWRKARKRIKNKEKERNRLNG